MRFKIFIQVERLQIDLSGQIFVRPVLVYEEFYICLRTNELSLLLDNL